jgi:hypothetical protein
MPFSAANFDTVKTAYFAAIENSLETTYLAAQSQSVISA